MTHDETHRYEAQTPCKHYLHIHLTLPNRKYPKRVVPVFSRGCGISCAFEDLPIPRVHCVFFAIRFIIVAREIAPVIKAFNGYLHYSNMLCRRS